MKHVIDRATLLAHRLERQGLGRLVADEAGYQRLVRSLQPVAPVYFSRPGSPPRLVQRTRFDEGELADCWRGCRALVKGRFWGGNIGYVLAEDLALYGAAFRRPLPRLSPLHEKILQTLKYEGPLSPRQLSAESGVRHKELMPGLHRLQQAFLVYEDQEDDNWERPFGLFAAEWPEVDLEALTWEEAAAEVVKRLVHSQVFLTETQVCDWSQWPVRKVRQLLEVLEGRGEVIRSQVKGLGEGWTRPEDQEVAARQPARGTFMLHKADPLVKSHQRQLKQQFAGEVLQYLLIDGDFRGAVCGHWRIGPHDVEDIALHLPRREIAARREEILAAVAEQYHPPHSQIRRYAGQAIRVSL
ncbi:MAG: winged helix DNA-binding domain-containing protein [Candidatus Latescibacteria bacterium]|nr:winged helix DNA-binding domain-containing protein [Candidatus Latescibacterota bacterium]